MVKPTPVERVRDFYEVTLGIFLPLSVLIKSLIQKGSGCDSGSSLRYSLIL